MTNEENKERYLELLSSVNRDGINELIEFIKSTDFFKAPASTIYHSNTEGGLCKHSLNVYDSMLMLNSVYLTELNPDSIKLVALLHDLSKVDLYELNYANKKQYTDYGSQKDAIGLFNWVQVPYYKKKDSTDREYVFGDHGVSSFLMINKYIKLTDSEMAAIINHHGVFGANSRPIDDITEIFERYPLAAILHLADSAATYIVENKYYVE